jgi:hypothetical protein
MAKLRADHERTGLDQLDVATQPARDAAHFRRIITAQRNLAAAEQELRDAVKAAREAGDSWTVIGAALDVSRRRRSKGSATPDTARSEACVPALTAARPEVDERRARLRFGSTPRMLTAAPVSRDLREIGRLAVRLRALGTHDRVGH